MTLTPQLALNYCPIVDVEFGSYVPNFDWSEGSNIISTCYIIYVPMYLRMEGNQTKIGLCPSFRHSLKHPLNAYLFQAVAGRF